MISFGNQDCEEVTSNELKSLLVQERQINYKLEQNLKTTERDLSFQIQNLTLQLRLEKEKNAQLEKLVLEFNSLDSSKLQLQNTILSVRLEALEKDCSELSSKFIKCLSKDPTQNTEVIKKMLDSMGDLLCSKINPKKLLNFDETIQGLNRKNLELQEEILSQNEKFEEEVQILRESIESYQNSLNFKNKANAKLSERLENTVKQIEALKTEVNDLEEKLKLLEIENERLIKDIHSREKKIKTLSHDLNRKSEESQDIKDLEIENLFKKIKNLTAIIKKNKFELEKTLTEKEEARRKILDLQAELSRKTEGFDREKKSLTEKIKKIKEKKTIFLNKSAEKEEKIRKDKDEIIANLQNKLALLKQKNGELEKRFDDQEMHLKEEISLSDEISQLLDTNYTEGDEITADLKNDEISQELKFQFLVIENTSLKNQFENLVPNLLLTQPEYKNLLLEKQRLEKQLDTLQDFFEEELKKLKVLLEETEILALNASMKYAEAATDRDYFYKLYIDYKKQNSSVKISN